jgi:hypothetical protein
MALFEVPSGIGCEMSVDCGGWLQASPVVVDPATVPVFRVEVAAMRA